MHELALAQGVVDIIVDHAARQAFTRARAVHLEIGMLSSVMPEALQQGFEVTSAGTVAQGATLHITRPPGTAMCMECSKQSSVESRLELCPLCGSARLIVTGGDEMRVVELEVD